MGSRNCSWCNHLWQRLCRPLLCGVCNKTYRLVLVVVQSLTPWLATNTLLPPHDLLPIQLFPPHDCRYQCNPPTPWLATNALLPPHDLLPMQSSSWLSLPMHSSQPITVATNALLPPHDWHYQCNPLIPWLSLPTHSSHDCHYQMHSSHTMAIATNATLPPHNSLPMQSSRPMTGTTNAILPSHDWYYQCNPPVPWLVLPMQSSHSVTVTTNATLLTFCVNEILQGLGCSLRLKQYNTELTDPLSCLLWLKSRRPSPRASRWELSPMAEQKATVLVVFLRWLWDEKLSPVMITAGSWMSSPWVKRVKLAIKNKTDLSRFSSLLVSHSYGDALLFSRTSHRTDCTWHKELNHTWKGPYAPK